MKSNNFFCLLIIGFFFTACNNNSSSNANKSNDSLENANKNPSLKIDEVSYNADNTNLHAYVAYDDNIKGKRPGIIVVHEWWGMNDYPKMRARKLAELGYVAMAVDLYGNGKTVDNDKDAGALATPFYSDPEMTKRRLEVFISNLKKYPEVDTTKIAAIGYCFGGGMVLNTARLGENLAAVVSFHGSLIGTPARKDLLKSKILVCHGMDDKFVSAEEVQKFKKQMDSIGADYELKQYPNATHAFTNPAATETGKRLNMPIAYNPAADSASWNDMKKFFERVFK
jgi:dienelactone hydrolase